MATTTSRTLRVLLGLLVASTRSEAAPEPAPPPAPVQLQLQGGGQIRIEGGQLQIIAAPAAGQAPGKDDVKPGYLGLLLEETFAEDIEGADPDTKDDGKKNHGAGILRVVDDTPAAKAGMLDGDRVMLLDGKEVKNSAQFREMIRAGKPDQAVKLTILREGKELQIKAKLGAAPDNAVAFQFGGLIGTPAVPGVVVFYRSPTLSKRDEENAAGNVDTVFLRDGNHLIGKVQSLASDKGLTLQREGVPAVELLDAGISAVSFAECTGAESPPAKAILGLRDGSWFGGESLSMEQGKIFMTLPGGQRLTVPREQAQWMTLADGPPPQTYEGPVSMAGWSSGSSGMGKWEYKDGFLRCLSNGPVARNIERMPDPLDLSFEVVYPALAQVFNVTLFAGAVENTATPGSLAIQFHPQYLQGNHFDGLRYNQYRAAGQPGSEVAGGTPVAYRYRLLVDRVNGKALIYVNGVKRADWKLSKVKPEDLVKCAPGLVFMPQIFNSNQTFQIGRVRLRPWDGQEPGDGLDSANPKDDQVLTAHAAARDGHIERITGQEILFANQGAVPRREKPLYVRFATANMPVAELPPVTALLRLKKGGEFAVTEIHGNGDTVTFTTRFGAKLTQPVSSLRSLEFYPRPDQPDATASGVDVLTLTDGTRLKGKLVTPISGDNLRWQIAAARTPVEFPRKAVAGILLPKTEASSETAVLNGSSAARLSNGDWLPGEVVSLNDRQLVLGNNLSPQLILPTDTLRGLYVGPGLTASLSDGGSGREPWSNGWNSERAGIDHEQLGAISAMQESWSYHDGAYSLIGGSRYGAMGLAHKWPAYAGAYAVNLEVESADVIASFQIQLFNTKGQPTINLYCPGNGRVYVGFNTIPNRLNGPRFGNKEFRAARSPEKKLRISLVLDRPAKTFRVIFDNKEIGKIAFKDEDEANAAMDVAGMNITPQGGRKLCRISNLWLAPWGGLTGNAPDLAKRRDAETPQTEVEKEARAQQVIYLANGDEAVGAIEGIDANLLTLNTEVGSLTLPLKRVAWLHFPGPEIARSDDAVRLRFHDRGVLSVKDLHIENDRVNCLTLHGQALDFPFSLVKELVYRPVP